MTRLSKKCALTGVELHFGEKYGESCNASLDRIDSSMGYVPGNIQWLHKDVNKMKNSLNQQYFVDMCKLVALGCEV